MEATTISLSFILDDKYYVFTSDDPDSSHSQTSSEHLLTDYSSPKSFRDLSVSGFAENRVSALTQSG